MKKVVLDPLKCTACRTCEVQCAVSHSRSRTLYAALFESPPSLARVRVSWAPGLNVPVRCVHCETAPCLLACPVGAIDRDGPTGTVQLREERCIGCFTCLLVCPYGAVRLSFDGTKAHKCDGCLERLRAREEPACSASCPTRALSFAEPEEIAGDRMAAAAAREAAALAAAPGARQPSCLDSLLTMREGMAHG
ncbi:MAG: 4Fe-4S dicluster domain-containing protein [Gemmatimonadota bacterium]